MTTIAYRDGTMACDSCWTYGSRVDVLTSKIVRLSSGALLGGAGQNDSRSLYTLLDRVKTPKQLPSYEAVMAVRADALMLLVLPKGRVYKIATTLVTPENWDIHFQTETDDLGLWEITGAYAAVGSGADLALVAMDCHKAARDAVRLACKYDPYSRPPIHTLRMSVTK